MSILETAQQSVPMRSNAATLASVATLAAAELVPLVKPPYRRGDRICATSPEGMRFQVRVEAVTPTADGEFSVLGAVVAPRKFRSHVLSTVVDADGYGPAIRPVA